MSINPYRDELSANVVRIKEEKNKIRSALAGAGMPITTTTPFEQYHNIVIELGKQASPGTNECIVTFNVNPVGSGYEIPTDPIILADLLKGAHIEVVIDGVSDPYTIPIDTLEPATYNRKFSTPKPTRGMCKLVLGVASTPYTSSPVLTNLKAGVTSSVTLVSKIDITNNVEVGRVQRFSDASGASFLIKRTTSGGKTKVDFGGWASTGDWVDQSKIKVGVWNFSTLGNKWDPTGKIDGAFNKFAFDKTSRLYIAASDAGLWKSTDCQTWIQTAKIDGIFKTVVFNNNMWLAGSTLGIWKSTDGNTWTTTNKTTGTVSEIVFANNTWFCSTDAGIWTSTDGNAWTVTAKADGSFSTIHFANNLFLAGSTLGIWKSTDGNTWTQTAKTTGNILTIYWANNTWVAGTDAGLFWSGDGNGWNISNKTTGIINSVCCSDNVWFAGTTDGILKSSTGGYWDIIETIPKNILVVYYAGGVWLAGTSSGILKAKSKHSIKHTSKIDGSIKSLVKLSTNRLLAGTTFGTFYSDNGGVNWGRSSRPDGVFNSMVFQENVGVACTDAGILRTTDNWNWNATTKSDGKFNSSVFANGIWLAGADNIGIWKSTDGYTWTQTAKTDGSFKGIIFANSLFIAASSLGIWKSTDGYTWTQTAKTDGSFTTVYYINGLLLAGSTLGIWKSTDGNTWTQTGQTTGNILTISYSDNTWLAGTTDGILESQDGNTWSKIEKSSGAFNAFVDTGKDTVIGSDINGIWMLSIAGIHNKTERIISSGGGGDSTDIIDLLDVLGKSTPVDVVYNVDTPIINKFMKFPVVYVKSERVTLDIPTFANDGTVASTTPTDCIIKWLCNIQLPGYHRHTAFTRYERQPSGSYIDTTISQCFIARYPISYVDVPYTVGGVTSNIHLAVSVPDRSREIGATRYNFMYDCKRSNTIPVTVDGVTIDKNSDPRLFTAVSTAEISLMQIICYVMFGVNIQGAIQGICSGVVNSTSNGDTEEMFDAGVRFGSLDNTLDNTKSCLIMGIEDGLHSSTGWMFMDITYFAERKADDSIEPYLVYALDRNDYNPESGEPTTLLANGYRKLNIKYGGATRTGYDDSIGSKDLFIFSTDQTQPNINIANFDADWQGGAPGAGTPGTNAFTCAIGLSRFNGSALGLFGFNANYGLGLAAGHIWRSRLSLQVFS